MEQKIPNVGYVNVEFAELKRHPLLIRFQRPMAIKRLHILKMRGGSFASTHWIACNHRIENRPMLCEQPRLDVIVIIDQSMRRQHRLTE